MSLEAELAACTAAIKGLDMTLRVLIENAKNGPSALPIGGRVSSDDPIPSTTNVTNIADAPKPRGRPAGSTNKPKEGASSQPEPAASTAATAGASSQAEEFDPFGDAAEAPAARTYNVEEIRAALKALHTRDAAGKAACLSILTSRGIKGVAEIKEADFPKVAEEIVKAGGKV